MLTAEDPQAHRRAARGGPAACRQDHHGRDCCLCGSAAARAVQGRLAADISRRLFIGGTAAALLPYAAHRSALAGPGRPEAPRRPLLLTNLTLFDGSGSPPRRDVNILIEGARIAGLPGLGEAVAEAEVLDCGGRLVLPGLIDAHWHATLCGVTQVTAMTADIAYVHLVAAQQAEATLLRGFTSVRDAGGPAFALKRAIDEGLVAGPRIFPSGAMISQTSGHGDFRMAERCRAPARHRSAMRRAPALR